MPQMIRNAINSQGRPFACPRRDACAIRSIMILNSDLLPWNSQNAILAAAAEPFHIDRRVALRSQARSIRVTVHSWDRARTTRITRQEAWGLNCMPRHATARVRPIVICLLRGSSSQDQYGVYECNSPIASRSLCPIRRSRTYG